MLEDIDFWGLYASMGEYNWIPRPVMMVLERVKIVPERPQSEVKCPLEGGASQHKIIQMALFDHASEKWTNTMKEEIMKFRRTSHV